MFHMKRFVPIESARTRGRGKLSRYDSAIFHDLRRIGPCDRVRKGPFGNSHSVTDNANSFG